MRTIKGRHKTGVNDPLPLLFTLQVILQAGKVSSTDYFRIPILDGLNGVGSFFQF